MKFIYHIAFWGTLLLTACEQYDTLMPEPPVGSISSNQLSLVETFSPLTCNDTSVCSIIYDQLTIPNVLCRLVSSERNRDIVFIVDKTGSMSDDIDIVRQNINDIIRCIPRGCRLGAASYGDIWSDGIDWYDFVDLDRDFNKARAFIDNIRTVGGGDTPESVYDAIWKALDEMSWQNCSPPPLVIVMGDAPPHVGSRTQRSLADIIAKTEAICPDNVKDGECAGVSFRPIIIIN
jgi:hypothetical protein